MCKCLFQFPNFIWIILWWTANNKGSPKGAEEFSGTSILSCQLSFGVFLASPISGHVKWKQHPCDLDIYLT